MLDSFRNIQTLSELVSDKPVLQTFLERHSIFLQLLHLGATHFIFTIQPEEQDTGQYQTRFIIYSSKWPTQDPLLSRTPLPFPSQFSHMLSWLWSCDFTSIVFNTLDMPERQNEREVTIWCICKGQSITIKTRGTLHLYIMKSKLSRQQTFKDRRIKAFKIKKNVYWNMIHNLALSNLRCHNAAMLTFEIVHKKGVLK